jgi:hypothetical protein
MIHNFHITESYLNSPHTTHKTWERYLSEYKGDMKIWVRKSRMREGHVWVVSGHVKPTICEQLELL